MVKPPEGPGLGAKIDFELIERKKTTVLSESGPFGLASLEAAAEPRRRCDSVAVLRLTLKPPRTAGRGNGLFFLQQILEARKRVVRSDR